MSEQRLTTYSEFVAVKKRLLDVEARPIGDSVVNNYTNNNTISITGGNMAALSGYGSLAAAKTAIGSVPMTVLQDVDIPLSASTHTVVPTNIKLIPTNGAAFVAGGAGATLEFQGRGLDDTLTQRVVFKGFSPGDITFTGANYPKRISTAIFDNATASARMNMADMALIGKTAHIYATPGNIGERISVHDNHHLRLAAGTFTNSFAESYRPAFALYNNTSVKGAGAGVTTVYETSGSALEAIAVFGASGSSLGDVSGANNDINISDLMIQGAASQTYSQATSAVSTGNTTRVRIDRVHFRQVHGFAVSIGSAGSAGNYARDVFVTYCLFDEVAAQNLNPINVIGFTLSNNRFVNQGRSAFLSYDYFVDCEPNTELDVVKNGIITGNDFDGSGTLTAGRSIHAARIQHSSNILFSNNRIHGADIGATSGSPNFTSGLTINDSENIAVLNNTFNGFRQYAIASYNSADLQIIENTIQQTGYTFGLFAITFQGVADSVISDNKMLRPRNPNPDYADDASYGFSYKIKEAAQQINVNVSGANVTISGGGVGWNFLPHWVGRTVNINGVDKVVQSVTDRTHLVLTTSAATATGVTLNTKFGNNQYTDNLNAIYSLQTGSLSKVIDNVTYRPIYYWNAFVPNVSATYTIGELTGTTARDRMTILSLSAYARVAPSGNTTAAAIRVSGGVDQFGTPSNLDLTLDAQTKYAAYTDKFFFGYGDRDVYDTHTAPQVKVQTAAVGGTLPADINIVIAYRMGLPVVYE